MAEYFGVKTLEDEVTESIKHLYEPMANLPNDQLGESTIDLPLITESTLQAAPSPISPQDPYNRSTMGNRLSFATNSIVRDQAESLKQSISWSSSSISMEEVLRPKQSMEGMRQRSACGVIPESAQTMSLGADAETADQDELRESRVNRVGRCESSTDWARQYLS